MTTKRETAIVDLGLLERLLSSYVKRKYNGHLTKITTDTLHTEGTIRIYFDVEVSKNIEEFNKTIEDARNSELSNSKIKEPKFKIDDTIVIFGRTEEGRDIVRRFGHVWKVIQGGVERWMIRPFGPKISGKYFCGTEKNKKIFTSTQHVLEKDPGSIKRKFTVIGACPFPKDFKWKEYQQALEAKGINIKEL